MARAQWSTSGTYVYYNSGNVGIGTSSPAQKLSIQGGLRIDNGDSFTGGTINSSTENSVAWLSFGGNNSGEGLASARTAGATNQSGLDFYTDYWSRMSITNAGNVGIGVTSPGTKLDVMTTSSLDCIRVGYNGTGTVRLQPNSLSAGAFNSITLAGDAGIVYAGASIGSGTFGFVIAPWQNATTGIRLDQNGNVGIGTSSTQGYMLAVNGSAVFTKAVVKLYANWPDYVFQPGYYLPSLDSVSKYIRQNDHLPDMPSADSIARNGLDLGANQAALLKKIEELTLYVISISEKNESLQAEVDQLKKQLSQR